jgi:hypothetical protein
MQYAEAVGVPCSKCERKLYNRCEHADQEALYIGGMIGITCDRDTYFADVDSQMVQMLPCSRALAHTPPRHGSV